MAVDVLNSTTLSAALDAETVNFAVAATTNITAGQMLVVRGEAMKVMAVDDPSSGYVVVRRGVDGTYARAHASGQRVWIGDHDAFKAVRDNANRLGLVGASGTLPDYMLPGQRAFDDNGNEYVMVELTAECFTGTTVVISVDGNFQAKQAVGGTQGNIGLVSEHATSDQFVWAQIFGYNSFAQETICASAGTSAYIAVPATTASTPSVGLAALATPTTAAAYIIHGMFIVGVASSAVTSTTGTDERTGIAYPVWLNYPYTTNKLETIETSNS